MESLLQSLTWRHVAGTIVAYYCSLAMYRLFFHPLAQFPGPRLAAISRWYEAYYDVIQNGQYTFKIRELHNKYGPIIRISPHELHVHDPAFFEHLYRHDGRWDRYSFATDGFGAKGAFIFTPGHDLHKARRQPLNAFFSKARVANVGQDIIRHHLDKFCSRLSQAADANSTTTTKTINLGAACAALARDITNEYVLGKSYGSLDDEKFDEGILVASQGGGAFWRLGKHIPGFVLLIGLMRSMPLSMVDKMADENTKVFIKFIKETMTDVATLIKQLSSSSSPSSSSSYPYTAVHAILSSPNLPPGEKTPERVGEDLSTVTGAGFETTAGVLRIVLFNLYKQDSANNNNNNNNNNNILLQTLRSELDLLLLPQTEDEKYPPLLRALEKLPYLTAVIKEGLRLLPAVASRSARVFRRPPPGDRDGEFCYYQQQEREGGEEEGKTTTKTKTKICWRIPEGTPVGMTTLLVHTDEEWFPDPRGFRPERWLVTTTTTTTGGADDGVRGSAVVDGGSSNINNNKAYQPFSRGSRGCVGMHLAWAELYLTIATVVRNFDFEFDDDVSAEDFLCSSDQFAIGSRCRGNLNAKVIRRTSSS